MEIIRLTLGSANKSEEEERHSKILAYVKRALTSMNIYKNMPECLELVITKIIYYIALSVTTSATEDQIFHVDKSEYSAILERGFKRLRPNYKNEDYFSSAEIITIIDGLEHQKAPFSLAFLMDTFEKLFQVLEIIRPFSF